ncbi:CubicO group peptidase (beta-lactamase class C family) [Paenibacillus phyllosphaerae]|uniref:CubicO group peptidase (Beta-lactamase class C family) n=1 Tax=Paenibacillus phyllosphaerae TaxID=274593 RepID=A0A7W5FR98_9BACL|nr:serine hydrolase [Paenibacillus phyllosphaerae]MBB3114118.1 CubicO group peptidase (beta-lactamase class C family) [Paenibacillus phyllosphaerae]
MQAASHPDLQRLPRSTPEEHGVDSGAIGAFLDAAAATGQELHSLMLLRHGTVIAEGSWAPYDLRRKRLSNSISKSFTSAAIGLAQAEGLLSIEDSVMQYFPDSVPVDRDPKLPRMRIKHLLAMASGHDVDTVIPVLQSGSSDWVEAFLALPIAHEPGTFFKYNTGATYMLSAILQRVTGTTLVDYLQERLFLPLGIADVTWDACPKGITAGGWGLSLTTEEMARFGQLYLNGGRWQGRQLIPEDWVQASVRPQIANGDNQGSDWASGYGYQFWCNRYGTYRADGAFGQIILVMPNEEAVLAFTSSLSDLSQVLNAVWSHLLPALQAGRQVLPADEAAYARLQSKLEQLAVAAPEHKAAPFAPYAGKIYNLVDNVLGLRRLTLHPDSEGGGIYWQDEAGEHRFTVGEDEWALTEWPLAAELWKPGERPRRIAAAAAGRWQEDGSYRIYLRLLDTAYQDELTCRFEGENVTITYHRHFSVTPLAVEPITGVSN